MSTLTNIAFNRLPDIPSLTHVSSHIKRTGNRLVRLNENSRHLKGNKSVLHGSFHGFTSDIPVDKIMRDLQAEEQSKSINAHILADCDVLVSGHWTLLIARDPNLTR
ncbi:hypothetical protein P5673_033184 [Acropora cervicornis]|uniref:Uncharacterized protein n=1 Tax=Acropora cervicornis TaxID=6130 RepID=A0AAD9URB6_ACRCE|nr:hypothetical protein P5673_033184 [Acropora cervicornis]